MEEGQRARDDEALRDSQRESMVAGALGLGGGKWASKPLRIWRVGSAWRAQITTNVSDAGTCLATWTRAAISCSTRTRKGFLIAWYRVGPLIFLHTSNSGRELKLSIRCCMWAAGRVAVPRVQVRRYSWHSPSLTTKCHMSNLAMSSDAHVKT